MTSFLPTAEQRELVDAVKDPIAEILPLTRVHQGGGPALAPIAELGCLGIALPEASGGSGLTVVEEALIFEQLGRQLASPALLASTLAAHLLSGSDAEAAGASAAGAQPVGLAVPTANGRILLIDAGEAERIVLLTPQGPALLPASALSDRTALDGEQWKTPLESAALASAPVGDEALASRTRLLIAAQLSGMAAGARDMAVDYAKFREQFGKPIGAFQAVKHHCANMAASALAAADLVAFASVALAEGREDASFQVLSALTVAIRAAKANAAINIQVHGGIGFSDEADPHLFVKHAHVWETIAGGSRNVQAALLAEPSPYQGGASARH